MQPWLKAGGIGAVILAILALVSLIPAVGLLCCLAWPVVYAGVGILAASNVPPVRDAGRGAGQGALAAVLASFVGGIVLTIVDVVQSTALTAAQVQSLIPPQLLQQYEAAGGNPAVLQQLAGPGGVALGGGLCCGVGLVVAAIVGAIGGAIYAGVKPQ